MSEPYPAAPRPYRPSLAERLYLPLIPGLFITLKHFLRNLLRRGDTLVCSDEVLSTPHAAAFTDDALADLRRLVISYMEEVLRP